MRNINSFIIIGFILFMLFTLCGAGQGAYAEKANPWRSTTYPIPRFVSLASSEVNVRTGPGRKYPVKWVYRQKQMPVEIILEFDAWRKIRDQDGAVGWVHGSLLSGRRFAVSQGENVITVTSKPRTDSKPKLKLEAGVRLRLHECIHVWCKVEVAETKGWVQKNFLWGVYPQEKFD